VAPVDHRSQGRGARIVERADDRKERRRKETQRTTVTFAKGGVAGGCANPITPT
jgi:hypothetical protein